MNFSILAGFEIEFKPQPQPIDSKFGNYSLSVEVSGGSWYASGHFPFMKIDMRLLNTPIL